jgi:hypothetical protein
LPPKDYKGCGSKAYRVVTSSRASFPSSMRLQPGRFRTRSRLPLRPSRKAPKRSTSSESHGRAAYLIGWGTGGNRPSSGTAPSLHISAKSPL